ncbi:DUF1540 domain-containing protein [Dethiobacter alkaliphilus]|uniref:DUF1540 domain-containing protein n=1 Tax=Dethiobacter alkaliphilus AHT 1 TaxID=555088 RepID=C0GK21_DETAL|nr:DUF1540 domain-containing protein [Dethiobacter alkaliphilus]EEG76291.1 protein of unknown function DUF1540 [Dethiobacter alkaliphilus AHT 1]
MHHNKGDSPQVKCVVDSCEYWEQGNQCTASTIEVSPPHAVDSEETDCNTFKPKNGISMKGEEAIKGISGDPQNLQANFGVVDPVELE